MDNTTKPTAKDFYTLTPEKQTAEMVKLARKALLNYDIDPNAELKLLIFRENCVFSVTTADNKYAMRIHRYGYHTDEELYWELHWMEALNEYGVPTPDIIKGKDGQPMYVVSVEGVPEPRQVDILAWVNGAPPEGENLVPAFRTLGKLNAKTHLHVEKDWEMPAGFTRHHWDEDTLMGPKAISGNYEDLQNLSPEQLELMHKANAIARRKLKAYGKGKDRYGLIHADMLIENILADGEDVRLIDFDDAGFGWFMHDFGTCLFFHQPEPHYKAVYDVWLEGYQSIRPLSQEDIDMIPTFLMCRGLFALGWLHTRRETAFAQEVTEDILGMVVHNAEGYVASDGKEVGGF